MDENTRKFLLNIPVPMRKAWEARWLGGRTLDDAEAGIRKSRFPLYKKTGIGAIISIAAILIDLHFGLRGSLFAFVFLAVACVVIGDSSSTRRSRYEGMFESLKRDLEAAGLFELLRKGHDFQRIRRTMDERLTQVAQTILTTQERIHRERYDNRVSEDQLATSLDKRRQEIFGLDWLLGYAETFGLEPESKKVYFDRARALERRS